jgi:glycosyltransferase involved in cell wall biosynthesis/SAM-dependent methyltransferase
VPNDDVNPLRDERDFLARHALEIDAAAKLCAVRVAELEATVDRVETDLVAEREQLAALRVEYEVRRLEIGDLHREIDATRESWSWRIGNGLVEAGRPLRPVLRLARKFVRRARGQRPLDARTDAGPTASPVRPKTMDDAEMRAIVAADLVPDQEGAPDGASSVLPATSLAAVVQRLRAARPSAPKLLTAAERSDIDAAMADVDADPAVNGAARALLDAGEPRSPSRGQVRDTVVIDVAAVQFPRRDGTRTHAVNVLDAMVPILRERARVLLLVNPALPLPVDHLDRVDGIWTVDEDLSRVGAFVDLASVSILHLVQRHAITLSTTPGIRRVGVWLDAIMGHYPERHLWNDVNFLDYQSSLERLSMAEVVLSLTESSASELPEGCPRPGGRVAVSGSRPGLSMADVAESDWSPPFGRYAVVVGNSLPHKNVLAGVFGSVVAQRSHPDLGVVVVADLEPGRRAEILSLYEQAGGKPGLFAFVAQLGRPDFATLINRATVTVVPSRHEGLSLPVLESLELGTPLVASDIAAHRELLGDSTVLVDPSDPAAFGTSIGAVLDAPDEMLAIQRAAVMKGHPSDRFDAVIREVVLEISEGLQSPIRPEPSPTWREPSGQPTRSVIPVNGSNSLPYSKICNVEDFTHPDLRPVIEECIDWERLRSGGLFPETRQDRKYWEIAMTIRAFRDCGLLDGSSDFLGVGVGADATIFLLTRWARRVMAIDHYLSGEPADGASPSMLTDPAAHWPFPWNAERLEVSNMDATDLGVPDESVDGLFSSISPARFGNRDDVDRSLDEMFRVLRPGGILSLSTDYRLWGPAREGLGDVVLDADEIGTLVLADRGWSLADGFDSDVSDETMATSVSQFEAMQEYQRSIDSLGGRYLHHMELTRYPHIVDEVPGRGSTSVHLLLRKDD